LEHIFIVNDDTTTSGDPYVLVDYDDGCSWCSFSSIAHGSSHRELSDEELKREKMRRLICKGQCSYAPTTTPTTEPTPAPSTRRLEESTSVLVDHEDFGKSFTITIPMEHIVGKGGKPVERSLGTWSYSPQDMSIVWRTSATCFQHAFEDSSILCPCEYAATATPTEQPTAKPSVVPNISPTRHPTKNHPAIALQKYYKKVVKVIRSDAKDKDEEEPSAPTSAKVDGVDHDEDAKTALQKELDRIKWEKDKNDIVPRD